MESEVVIDSSALVAMISGEQAAQTLLARTVSFNRKLVGAPSVLETAMVLVARKNLRAEDLTAFLTRINAIVVPFDLKHAEAAVQAFEQFGRGRHAAGLNFGDCMSYAVAKIATAPLLYVGDDFSKTDLDSA